MRTWKFHEFELDPREFRLIKHGSEVEIGKRSFDLLHYLIRNRDRVVSSEELLSEVWKATALSSSAIPTCVLDLRKTLGDESQPFRIVRTVRGRGYQFIADTTAPHSLDFFIGLREIDPPFVGRTQELARLRAALDAAESLRTCQTIVVQGNAGFGKTRLLQEFLKTTPDHLPCYVVQCPELEGVPPFWPWKILLNQIDPRTSLDLFPAPSEYTVDSDYGHASSHPDPQRSLWGDFPDRFSILNTWSNILRRLCAKGPAIVVFEDLHRTDFDSIELLRWISNDLRSEPLVLICSARRAIRNSAISEEISSILTFPSSLAIRLSPLSLENVVEMIGPRFGNTESLAEILHERTDGHPFFLQRLINLIDSGGSYADAESAISNIPISNEEILSHQLNDLPRRARRALEVACVLGNTFSISTACAAGKIESSEFLGFADAALAAGIVSEDPEDPDRMQFAHMILRDALYESLRVADRKNLHAEIARVLIESESAALAESAGTIADHLEQALPVSDLESVIKFARIAGRNCIKKFAFREARSHFMRVLSLTNREGAATDEERCRDRFDLAEAELYAGDRAAARLVLFDAAQIARTGNLPGLLAECGIRMSPDFLSIEVGPYDPELVALLHEALDILPEDERSLRAQVLARLSLALSWSGNLDLRARFALEAISIARRLDDPLALSSCLAARFDALHGPDRVVERQEISTELRRVVRRTHSRPGIILQHIRQISALLDGGDIQAVDVEIEACDSSVREMNVPQFTWYPLAFRAMRAIMKGDFDAATRLGERFLAIGERTQDSNVAASWACQMGEIQLELGNAGYVLPFAKEHVSRCPDVRAWYAALGMVHLNAGNRREAVDILETFDSDSIRKLFRETAGGAGIVFLGEIAIATDDGVRMAQIYDLCAPVGERSATLGFGMGYFGCFARYAGILANALQLETEAVEHLQSAVAIERHRAADLWRFHAELDLAETVAKDTCRRLDAMTLLNSIAIGIEGRTLPRVRQRHTELAREIRSPG